MTSRIIWVATYRWPLNKGSTAIKKNTFSVECRCNSSWGCLPNFLHKSRFTFRLKANTFWCVFPYRPHNNDRKRPLFSFETHSLHLKILSRVVDSENGDFRKRWSMLFKYCECANDSGVFLQHNQLFFWRFNEDKGNGAIMGVWPGSVFGDKALSVTYRFETVIKLSSVNSMLTSKILFVMDVSTKFSCFRKQVSFSLRSEEKYVFVKDKQKIIIKRSVSISSF